ncbi:MAG: glycosyltransferase [Microcystis aeruginosa Ma_MB_F_20061100_S20]|nr:MAG: glycosyltransferase [Microcystis aeruginosa Ma_MB_F_20061100_S20]
MPKKKRKTIVNYTITFACYNQVEYTRMCLESMKHSGTPLNRVVAIDNASTDDTLNYLHSMPLGGVIHNQSNLGCGVAWNQGALAIQSEWTIIMNNDVLLSPHWAEQLIEAGIRNNLDIVSPSMIEGPLNYDFELLARTSSIDLSNCIRLGWAHAVCLAVHKRVWSEVGYFRATPKLLGYEDTIFFHEARQAGMRIGTTGASWLHHFGSITQSAMKRERGLKETQDLGYRNNHKLLNQPWLQRKLDKIRLKRQLQIWKESELAEYGQTLWGQSFNGTVEWQ